MESLIEDVLRAAVQIALKAFGKDKTVSILAVEYDAADFAADEAEKAKFGDNP